MIEEHDALTLYCSQLGGEIPFHYCRSMNEELPCRKILVCWEYRLEISKFLAQHYSIDQIHRALAPPAQSRIEAILNLIEKSKKTTEENEE